MHAGETAIWDHLLMLELPMSVTWWLTCRRLDAGVDVAEEGAEDRGDMRREDAPPRGVVAPAPLGVVAPGPDVDERGGWGGAAAVFPLGPDVVLGPAVEVRWCWAARLLEVPAW